jgi:seryl-tRNA synthetase
MDHLDGRIRTLTLDLFGASEFRYPTVIPTTTMDRCGYFRSFPQLMMFVSRLHGDVDTYRGFLDAMAGDADPARTLPEYCGDFDHCLPPTMCFHTYHQLRDRPLPSPSMVVTARGKSFRFESRYRRSLERLWDFTIREIVFLGSHDFVLDCRRRLMEETFAMAESLGLGGRCEVANDPFFIQAGTAARVWSQQFLELKYELRLPIEAGRDVAVCSFNFHERFFGDSFGIRSADSAENVHTACAGFGLERLAYAFLCRHGLDPAGWPDGVRAAVAP